LAPSSGSPIFQNQSIGAGLSTTLTTGIGNITYTLTALYDTAESLGLTADTYRDSITLTVADLVKLDTGKLKEPITSAQ